jgi:DNA-binding winged helix-turn-helix (wHTH) protein
MTTQLVPMYSQERQEGSSLVSSAPSRYVRFGMFYLDLQKEELCKDGTWIKLQGKVYQALLVLIEKPGEVVTREALRARLWPSDTHVNYDANVNTTVNKLRQVLGDSPEQPAFVDTIPRKGYSFVAKVEYVNQAAALQALPPEESALAAADQDHSSRRPWYLPAFPNSKWFTAGVVALVIAGMLFGAALVLYAHR